MPYITVEKPCSSFKRTMSASRYMPLSCMLSSSHDAAGQQALRTCRIMAREHADQGRKNRC